LRSGLFVFQFFPIIPDIHFSNRFSTPPGRPIPAQMVAPIPSAELPSLPLTRLPPFLTPGAEREYTRDPSGPPLSILQLGPRDSTFYWSSPTVTWYFSTSGAFAVPLTTAGLFPLLRRERGGWPLRIGIAFLCQTSNAHRFDSTSVNKSRTRGVLFLSIRPFAPLLNQSHCSLTRLELRTPPPFLQRVLESNLARKNLDAPEGAVFRWFFPLLHLSFPLLIFLIADEAVSPRPVPSARSTPLLRKRVPSPPSLPRCGKWVTILSRLLQVLFKSRGRQTLLFFLIGHIAQWFLVDRHSCRSLFFIFGTAGLSEGPRPMPDCAGPAFALPRGLCSPPLLVSKPKSPTQRRVVDPFQTKFWTHTKISRMYFAL